MTPASGESLFQESPRQRGMGGIVLAVVCGAWLLGSTPSRSVGPEAVALFYYNPDANVRNVGLLKTVAESYFRTAGLEVAFRPFVNLEDLEREALVRPPELILLPSWCVSPAVTLRPLEPVLIPTLDGSEYHQKRLVVSRSLLETTDVVEPLALDPRLLTGKRIASTLDLARAGEQVRRSVLDPLGISAKDVEFLRVPKDLDALLAVASRHAEAAVVLAPSLEMLRESNPLALKRVALTDRSQRVLNPCLYAGAVADRSSAIEAVLGAFLSMGTNDGGKRALQLMGYSAWVPYDPQVHDPAGKGGGR
ncbi:MAG: PhnD/SsuA/transferrin family substrate-binding protein [Planctomycetota bacterium]